MRFPLTLLAIALLGSAVVKAQGPGPGGGPPPPRVPRESAQVDITGYWVALVTEDWLWRMITPPKGDVTSVPVNPVGRRAANEWNLARDNADGEQCRAFGAAAVMRMPLRLHITWDDDTTLRIATDAGEQVRLLHFSNSDATQQPRSWQGNSTAAWTHATGFDLRVALGAPAPTTQGPPKGSLKVETTNLRAGYLRKNGVPYSENTQLTEFFSRVTTGGNDYLTVLTIVKDPVYLTGPFVTSSQFKKEADGALWSPSPCQTAAPLGEDK